MEARGGSLCLERGNVLAPCFYNNLSPILHSLGIARPNNLQTTLVEILMHRLVFYLLYSDHKRTKHQTEYG